MSDTAPTPGSKQDLIAAYKRVLRGYIDERPSGMRLRIAHVLGTHKSFVSQITNPSDPTPIPVRHIAPILGVCRLSPKERDTFLQAYIAAHPNNSVTDLLRRPQKSGYKTIQIEVPVFGDRRQQQEFELLIQDLVRRLGEWSGRRR